MNDGILERLRYCGAFFGDFLRSQSDLAVGNMIKLGGEFQQCLILLLFDPVHDIGDDADNIKF